MEDMIYNKSYQEYKAELDGELQRTAEGFVRIGYLLKVARDTNVLAESGYKTVAEFAEAEYNLNKTQVSRFISINDKFSEGGYSEKLQTIYQGYGYAKLTIMLQIPDEINEELSPSFSKAEIQEIRDEIAEEQKVTDIQRMIEAANEKETDLDKVDERTELLYKAILQLGEEDPEMYCEVHKARSEDLAAELPDIMAPAGDKIYSIRVRGIGRLMLSISELSEKVKLINSRTGEKDAYTWDEVAAGWKYAGIGKEETGEASWEARYERKCPVAPVQPKEPVKEKNTGMKKDKKKEQKKQSKVKKSHKDWASVYQIGQQVKVYANDHVGELIEKTEDIGKWKIKFATYQAEMNEAQFTEYIDEPQLNDFMPDVPRVENGLNTSTETDFETKEIKTDDKPEQVDDSYNLPGQMDLNTYKDSEVVEHEGKCIDEEQESGENGLNTESDSFQEAIRNSEEKERPKCIDEEQDSEENGLNTESGSFQEDIRNTEEIECESCIDEEQDSEENGLNTESDSFQIALFDRIEKLKEHIRSRAWNMALMDVDMLQEDIKRTKNIDEMEDDEE